MGKGVEHEKTKTISTTNSGSLECDIKGWFLISMNSIIPKLQLASKTGKDMKTYLPQSFNKQLRVQHKDFEKF